MCIRYRKIPIRNIDIFGSDFMNSKIQKGIVIENILAEVKQEIINDIVKEVASRRMDAVRPIGTTGAIAVSYSALSASMNLSPYYYSSEEQAKIVGRGLTAASKSDGMDGILKAAKEMVVKKSAVISKQTYALNPCTLSVLEKFCDEAQ